MNKVHILKRQKESKEGKKCTKCGNFPRTRQWWHLTLNFIRRGFPFLSIDEEVPRLVVANRRKETINDLRIPILGIKFKMPVVGRRL